ncbi:hypothetical protein [Sphingomonas sp. PAMC 26617]|uniref:hypothetical protein n=1 Tax=Sphingomonas sp. PAMC 26617 TaxID=1112216 RepID=UPI00030B0FBD|nr:hypothetical protein [Sphingomonas sp. PAMC 26617]
MSVRMALAKLCACVCGGAVVGGGAVHVVDRAQSRGHVARPLVKRVAHGNKPAGPVARSRAGLRARPGATTTCPAAAQPQVVVVSPQGAPFPLPYDGTGSTGGSGGGGAPLVIGGNSGFGGGGFLPVGFAGGGGAGGGGITLPATSTGPSSGGSTGSGPNGGSTTPTTAVTDPAGETGGRPAASPTPGSGGSASGGSTGGPVPGVGISPGTSYDQKMTEGTGKPGGPPAPVPAPPMVVLFGAAAAALVARKHFARRPSAPA